jgi:FkbM family methyltransferase
MRLFRDLRYRVFYGLALRKGWPLLALGDPAQECDWNVHPDELGTASVVYSGGVGNDITFEHALVERFGCRVVMFDPSPTGRATMARPENQIAPFHFVPVALAGHCGELSFHAPIHAEEGSYYHSTDGGETCRVPCTTLTALMREQGHSTIDLLKLDIEGSEYEVLDEIIEHRLPVRQICVEFHHGLMPQYRRSQTIRAILRLLWRGYRLLDQTGNNHTFYWSGRWPHHGRAER